MSNRLEEIARRKQALVARSEGERDELAALWGNIRTPINLASASSLFAKAVRNYPLWFTGVTGWLVSRRAKSLMRSATSARRALKWWRVVFPLWSAWRRFQSRK